MRNGDEDGNIFIFIAKWRKRPRNYQLSPASMRRWKNRGTIDAAAVVHISVKKKKGKRDWTRTISNCMIALKFRVVFIFETIYLVGTLCYFYLCFGCRL